MNDLQPRTIIVSNRLPVTVSKDENGKLLASPSSGGLATAMASVHSTSMASAGADSVADAAAASSTSTNPTNPDSTPLTSSSSLATARSIWLGWSGIDCDNESELKALLDPLGCVPIAISAAELSSFYDQFSNGVLWPLCHYLTEKIPNDFGYEHWLTYVKINQR